VAKSGAEGLICLGLPELGLGIAIRIADGSFRAHPLVVAEVLRLLGVLNESELDALVREDERVIFNHNRLRVGTRRASFQFNI
jgi:L-asparaginase II